MSNFLDILNTKIDDIEEPENLPEGTYIWRVSKVHKESTTASGEWFIIEVPIQPTGAFEEADDVDAEALERFGNLAMGTNSLRFMMPTASDAENDRKRTMSQLRRFLTDTLGIETDGSETIKELLARSVGHEFVAQATHRYVPDRDTTYVDVRNYMPLD